MNSGWFPIAYVVGAYVVLLVIAKIFDRMVK